MYCVCVLVGKRDSPLLDELAVAVDALGGVCMKIGHNTILVAIY